MAWCAAVPVVEVALDPDGLGVRGPDGEADARHVAQRGMVVLHMGAQDRPQRLVPALTDQVQVHLAQGGQEPVGVVDGWRRRAVVASPRAGSPGRGRARQRARTATQMPPYSCVMGTRRPAVTTETASARCLKRADR